MRTVPVFPVALAALGLGGPQPVVVVFRQAWEPRDAAVVSLLAFNGFRGSTLCGLDVGDLGVNGRRRTLAYAVKGGRSRTAPLSSLVVTHLDAHLAARREAAGGRKLHTGEPLILANSAVRLTRDGVRRILARCARAGDLESPWRVTPHVIRSTFASLSHKAGVSLWDHRIRRNRGPEQSLDLTLDDGSVIIPPAVAGDVLRALVRDLTARVRAEGGGRPRRTPPALRPPRRGKPRRYRTQLR